MSRGFESCWGGGTWSLRLLEEPGYRRGRSIARDGLLSSCICSFLYSFTPLFLQTLLGLGTRRWSRRRRAGIGRDRLQIHYEGMRAGSRDAGWVASPGRPVQKLPGEGPPKPALPTGVSAGGRAQVTNLREF